jgi:uncharacterized protein (TIGR00290 family)
MKKEKITLSWSGGKDAALAYYDLMRSAAYEIASILTSVTEGYERISMHGIPCSILKQQALSLEIELNTARIAKDSNNENYENVMRKVLTKLKSQGVNTMAFGDIFLQGIRDYRLKNLAVLDMGGVFPLWGQSSEELARRFISSGFKAMLVCVDSKCLSCDFAGREYDEKLLNDLPVGIDPCGENGEFHTFVYDGPIFKRKINYTKGDVVLRQERFYYVDLIDSTQL